MSDTLRGYQEYVMTGFTKMQPIAIERARGALVWDEGGREYVDCFAGISVVNAGHGNPDVVAAARDEIAAAFQPGDHLSTFGGNPVSCAAGFANVQYMLRENLPEQSRQKGEYAMARLRAAKLPLVGDVRGLGLMIGVELVTDEAKTPAAAEANAVREACLRRGVLIGVGGVHGNELRIQPPLVILKDELDRALGALSESLAEVGAGAMVTR